MLTIKTHSTMRLSKKRYITHSPAYMFESVSDPAGCLADSIKHARESQRSDCNERTISPMRKNSFCTLTRLLFTCAKVHMAWESTCLLLVLEQLRKPLLGLRHTLRCAALSPVRCPLVPPQKSHSPVTPSHLCPTALVKTPPSYVPSATGRWLIVVLFSPRFEYYLSRVDSQPLGPSKVAPLVPPPEVAYRISYRSICPPVTLSPPGCLHHRNNFCRRYGDPPQL